MTNNASFPYYWFNNRLYSIKEPAISPYDRGFTLGDGIFETIKITNQHPHALSEHLDRFEKGCRLLHLPLISRETIYQAIQALLEANFHSQNLSYPNLSYPNISYQKDATLRLTYSRGEGGRGLTPPTNPSPNFLLTLSPPSPTLSKPITLYISQNYKREANTPLHKIKSISMLPSLLARYEALENGAQDALFCNHQNYLTESTSANFLLQDDMLYTPPHHHGLLEGVSRHTLLKHKICIEKPLTIDDIPTARAAWLVTALSLTPISKINEISIPRNFAMEEKILKILYESII